MSIESEKKLERNLSKEVEKLGGLSVKLVALHFAGLPDRMCLLPGGRLFFAEIKTTKQKPTKIQLYVHKRLRKLGFIVHVIDSTEILKGIIRQYE